MRVEWRSSGSSEWKEDGRRDWWEKREKKKRGELYLRTFLDGVSTL